MSVTFSDDDLRLLKEQAKHQKYGEPIIDLDLEALLARLEAAESLISWDRGEGNYDDWHKLHEAWRRASGKDKGEVGG